MACLVRFWVKTDDPNSSAEPDRRLRQPGRRGFLGGCVPREDFLMLIKPGLIEASPTDFLDSSHAW
jgi:hypothetical protein